MHIKKINYQSRRDFQADYECEHCGNIIKDERGYDDRNFHDNVIPKMVCPKCKRTADESYRPLVTKYPEGMQI